jgi:hypothetical protein
MIPCRRSYGLLRAVLDSTLSPEKAAVRYEPARDRGREEKLDAIIAEKEAWQKWDNSTSRVMQKTVKELEEMGEQLEREFAETHPSSSPKQQPRKQQPTASKTTVANLSLEDMMA